MHSHFLRFVGMVALVAGTALPIQGQSVPVALRVTSVIAAPTIPRGITGPVAGNRGFYTEYVTRSGGPEAVIHWISEDGQHSVVYDLAGVPRGNDRQGNSLLAADYTPIPGGGLAVLGVWHAADGSYAGHSIITFDQQGSPGSVIDLSNSINPTHIASFGGGIFLVFGGKRSATGLGTAEDYLIDSHGAVLARHLYEKLEAPENPRAAAHDSASSGEKGGQKQTGEAQYPNTQAWQLFNRVSRTTLVSGDESNVYLIPPDQARQLFVVNREGEVNSLALDPVPALKDKHVIVLAAVESGGQLAIYFGVVAAHTPMLGNIDFEEKFLCLYDVRLGALQAAYQALDTRISPFLIGFDSGKFYFLSFPTDAVTHIRQPAIVVAGP